MDGKTIKGTCHVPKFCVNIVSVDPRQV